MPCIQCSRWLWRRLGDARRDRARVPDRIFDGVALGDWVAKIFRHERRDMVIALDERTYAVVLFPFTPRHHFRPHFAAALAGLLEDLEYPASVVAQECAALQFAPVTPLCPGTSLDTLSRAEDLCEIALGDMSDLRRVQLQVNEYPHGACPAPCAIDALAEVYAPALMRRRHRR